MFENSMTNSFGLTLFHGSPLNPPRGDFLVAISRSLTPVRSVFSEIPLKKKTEEKKKETVFSPPPGDLGGCLYGKKYASELMIQSTKARKHRFFLLLFTLPLCRFALCPLQLCNSATLPLCHSVTSHPIARTSRPRRPFSGTETARSGDCARF